MSQRRFRRLDSMTQLCSITLDPISATAPRSTSAVAESSREAGGLENEHGKCLGTAFLVIKRRNSASRVVVTAWAVTRFVTIVQAGLWMDRSALERAQAAQ